MQEKSKLTSRLFVLLVRLTVQSTFIMPGGRLAEKQIDDAIDHLTKYYGEVGLERIVDYCVYQAHRISGFGSAYMPRWKLSHSFGTNSVKRFITRKSGQKYYEDKWLSDFRLTREVLLQHIEDRSTHPLFRFIYPDYEDATKRRALSSAVGYYICGASTLLWTPFSEVCQSCTKSEACKIRTQKLYPEIYRLRVAEYNGKEVRRG